MTTLRPRTARHATPRRAARKRTLSQAAALLRMRRDEHARVVRHAEHELRELSIYLDNVHASENLTHLARVAAELD